MQPSSITKEAENVPSMGNAWLKNTSPTSHSSTTPMSTSPRGADCSEDEQVLEISRLDSSDQLSFSGFDDTVVHILPDELQMTMWLYEPVDNCSRELSQLTSLRDYLKFSPAMIWNFYELFPKITEYVFSIAGSHEGLRHSLLACSQAIRDLFSRSEPSESFFLQKTKSLRLLQESLSTGKINEEVAISIIMHVAMDVLTGRLKHTQPHLRGMFLILQQLEQKAKASGRELRPLALLIRRMAIRMDFACSSLYGDDTQFQALSPADEILDRKWLIKSAGISQCMSSQNIEWTLASFEMDNLTHRVYSFAKLSDELRKSGDPLAGEKVQLEYRKMQQGLDLWRERSIIREQEELERFARGILEPSTSLHSRFLHHEPLHLQSLYYGKLLNQWRMAALWASMAAHPIPGPEPVSHNRYTLAVEIGRTHAALGKEGFRGPSWHSLFFAGLAFGGKKRYPLECEWLLEMLRAVAVAFPVLMPVMEGMPALWESNTFDWTGLAKIYIDAGLLDS